MNSIKKGGCILFLIAFFIALSSISVFSVGISPAGYTDSIKYGQIVKYSFQAVNTMAATIGLEISTEGGDLDPYITLSDTQFDNLGYWEGKQFTVTITYPNELVKPGWHDIQVMVTELRKETGMVSAKARVMVPIRIMEAYPGKYLEAQVDAKNVNINETAPIYVNVNNYGTETINFISGSVDVYFGDEKLKTLELSTLSNLASYESGKMGVGFDTRGYSPGVYTAKATINYDGNSTSAEGKFRVGTLFIDIIDFTKSINKDQINPFNLQVESKWNTPISRVYADVNIKENGTVLKSFRTLDDSIGAWEQKQLTGYIDASGMSVGEKDVEIFLNYEGQQTIKQGKIDVIAPAPKQEAASPIGSGLTIKLTPMTIITILLIIIIILIAVGVIAFSRKRRD